MTLLIVAPNRDTGAVEEHLHRLAPKLEVRVWPELGDPEEIDFAVLWRHSPGLFARLPNLRAVTSYGAGVEAILDDPSLPEGLPVGRIAGPRLAADMAEFLAGVVIARHRGLFEFRDDQRNEQWRPWAPEALPTIGVLGLGVMAKASVRVFRALGYPVHGWSRSPRRLHGVACHHGQAELPAIAAVADYLICLLPLTASTRGILNAGLFATMKPGACLINVGRGDHLVEPDLIPALDAGRLGCAVLDVFAQEPLPSGHPFWQHSKIFMTPHCASFTLPREAAELMLESYRRIQRGQPPLAAVDRQRGY